MFKDIRKNKIVVHIKKPLKGVFSIPDGDVLFAAENIWEMCRWLYDEFIKDTKQYSDSSVPINNLGEIRATFAIHNTSRILCYVNHIYCLDGIINKLYQHMINRLQCRISNRILLNEDELRRRKEEIKDIRTFRNKVSAHTSYADSRNDNISLQLTSLMAIKSHGFQGGNWDSFRLGVVSEIAGGQPPNIKIPIICLKEIRPKMEEHYKNWTSMFVEKLQEAHQFLPITKSEYKIEKWT